MPPPRSRIPNKGKLTQLEYKNRAKRGALSENVMGWIDVYFGRMTVRHHPGADANTVEPGENFSLEVKWSLTGISKVIDLTGLTMEDLKLIETLGKWIKELIEPTIRSRDEAARVNLQEGDGSFLRSHRTVPRIVVRKWALDKHVEGVLHGPEDDAAGDEPAGDSGGATGAGGSAVAEHGETGDVPQDNPPEDD